jgi:hypothetical protein
MRNIKCKYFASPEWFAVGELSQMPDASDASKPPLDQFGALIHQLLDYSSSVRLAVTFRVAHLFLNASSAEQQHQDQSSSSHFQPHPFNLPSVKTCILRLS